jgi:hypothetical protein
MCCLQIPKFDERIFGTGDQNIVTGHEQCLCDGSFVTT